MFVAAVVGVAQRRQVDQLSENGRDLRDCVPPEIGGSTSVERQARNFFAFHTKHLKSYTGSRCKERRLIPDELSGDVLVSESL